ncbi:MAG: hypothetical protein JRH16_06175 [Deltaproteobacteria bacterium]|nr:hypothetical protein [Deltaproteobacteria bacterium]MBW2361514.1 hypothetical protein [Deltaproteobacteria bacterium]
MRKALTTRCAATLVAALALSAATPQTAACAEVENVWARWTAEVLERDAKWEIPIALIASLPAMLVITPFWAGQLALQAWDD